MISLDAPISLIKRIGPRLAEKLAKLQLRTVKDLLWHFPSRYEDFSNIRKIADLRIGEQVTVQGVIASIRMSRTWKRRMFIIEVVIEDETGKVKAIWFNQRFLLGILKKGRLVNLAGKVVKDSQSGLAITHPIYEVIPQSVVSYGDFGTKHTGRLVPIYPETRSVTSKMLRYVMQPVLEELGELPDSLPDELLDKERLPDLTTALRHIHFPDILEEAEQARRRFTFEDLFLLQLAHLREREALGRAKAYPIPVGSSFVKSVSEQIPFSLTESQQKALAEILGDLEKPHPMNRLLQGDVGSGKTIVAAIAALAVAKENLQSAFMAPTEVLARQHYETFKKLFSSFERGVGFLTSGEARIFYGEELETAMPKKDFIKAVADGRIAIIIGTHALISARGETSPSRGGQKGVEFDQLALIVVDEQHRFGVRQRAELAHGDAELPHFFSMSATPIPRTLSLTLFGDLSLSIIDQMPRGRKEIITKIVEPGNREKAYAFIRGQARKGRQAFVICPRIEPTTDDQQQTTEVESLITSRKLLVNWEVKNVTEEYEKLKTKVFPDLTVGMLHGKMKAKEKEEIMKRFKNREIDILVSTSVIEVGIDIPNATIMMIEGAERFGLAQLYQFRGRVGRGEHQSFCFLFTESSGQSTQDRLAALLTAKNGFELAEKDLEIRGPGEFLGSSQTGMPDLAMKALQNPDLLKESRVRAEELLAQDPDLERRPLLKERLNQFEKEVHLE